jgi:hypothetical protein
MTMTRMRRMTRKWMGIPTSFEQAQPPDDDTLVKNIKKRTQLKWERKDERFIYGKKKFRVFIKRDGTRISAVFLGQAPPERYGWVESTSKISDTSWQIAYNDNMMAVQMLRAGTPISNIFWQKRETSIRF